MKKKKTEISYHLEKEKKAGDFSYRMICAISIIFSIIFLIQKILNLNIQLPYQTVGLSVFIITLCLLDWVIRTKNISLNMAILVIVLEFLAVMGIIGYFNGNKARLKEIKEVLLLNDNNKIHCAVLRNFNDVILIKDVNSYMFVSKSDIKAIKYSK